MQSLANFVRKYLPGKQSAAEALKAAKKKKA